jgi:hypothetical protein
MNRKTLLTVWIIFGVLLVVALSVFFNELVGAVQILAEGDNIGHQPETGETSLMATLSLFATIATLIGFVSTTILAWRRESREVEKAQLDLMKQALEIEKLRRELDLVKVNQAQAGEQ